MRAENIDAVVIGTWPDMHARITVAAISAGKHVMCEARMARNAGEARMMSHTAWMNPSVVAQIVPSPFTLWADEKIKSMIADGFIGDVLAVEVRGDGGFVDRDGAMHWRYDFDLSGFNTMELGIWYEALMRWIGPAESVCAAGETFVKTLMDGDGQQHVIRVPDHLDVVARMCCGAVANMRFSKVCGLGQGPAAWLFGSEGTLKVTADKLFGGKRGDKQLSEIEIEDEKKGQWRVEQEFVNAIRGLEQIKLTDFETGVKYMEFTEAVIRSMQSGERVDLPLRF